MYEFLKYVLSELRTSLALAGLACLLAAGVLGLVWLLHRRKYRGEKQFPWARAMLWLVLAMYLGILLYATVLRGVGGFRQWNLHLFRAWREAWNNFTVKNWANVLLNVALFVPVGFLLPVLWKQMRKWYLTIPAGFGVSLAIELVQLALARGVCDVDDLFANTLGGAVGYFLAMALLSLRLPKDTRWKRVLGNLCLFLAPCLAIGGIFVGYSLQEFGNLPDAPAYTNNTNGVRWELCCELPEASAEQPVFQTQTRSIADCDAFAQTFKKIIGTEYDTVQYYQEAAYYMDYSGDDNGAHFLHVFYLDLGYEYSLILHDTPAWAETDRETLEAALEKFPLLLPDYAVFAAEGDGWHRFTVEQHVADGRMVDGTLRCRYAQDGTVRNIENRLLAYTYYRDVPVISPEEAYQRLCGGKFYDGGYFERRGPAAVRITACSLEYRVDTKGFYQPVYVFDVILDGEDNGYGIVIPAMK